MSTTPSPLYSSGSLEQTPHNGPAGMQSPEKARFRMAASRARRMYPGPVGDLIARELNTIEEFGWALGAQSSGMKLLKFIEGGALPADTAQHSAVRGA